VIKNIIALRILLLGACKLEFCAQRKWWSCIINLKPCVSISRKLLQKHVHGYR